MYTRIPRELTAAILTILCLSLLAGAASASVGPPVAIRMRCEPVPAQPGVPYVGQIELGPMTEGTLTGFRFEGKGWHTTRLDAPTRIAARKRESHLLEFEIVGEDPTQPVTFIVELDGRRISRTFDLSPEAYRKELDPLAADILPFIPRERRRNPGLVKPSRRKEDQVELISREELGKDTFTVHVSGFFEYIRPDGALRGVSFSPYTVLVDLGVIKLPVGAGMTEFDGWFETWVPWSTEWNDDGGHPKFSFEFRAGNEAVQVETPHLEQDYVFDPDGPAIPGTEYNVTARPHDEQGNNIAHIHRTISLAWSWFSAHLAQDVPYVEVQFPDDSAMYYVAEPFLDNSEIHAGGERAWREGSLVHEYGHHWMYNFGYWHDPAYWCNGHGDPLDPLACLADPSHSMWCSETTTDAVNEGLPHFIADVITRSWNTDYGLPAFWGRDMETIEVCTEDDPDALNDPNLTEGFFAAVLRDLEDPYTPPIVEDDTRFPGSDVSGAGPEIVLQIANQETYDSPMEFLLKCKARGEFPGALWDTARNCGFELDTEPPGAATQLVSTSHLYVGDSTDPTIDFTWTPPWDDLSGIQGYSVEFTEGSPPSVGPDETLDTHGGTGDYTSPILDAGQWWFSLRAVDWSGKWSPDWVMVGPYTIREAIPADLVFDQRTGWNAKIVARENNDSSPSSVPAPTLLPGNTAGTWFNWSWINDGEVAWPDTWEQGLFVDGEWRENWGQVGTPPGVSSYFINIGPHQVRGGRHTIQLRLDTTDLIHESNATNDAEANNGYARQFVWTPLWLDPGVRVQRPAPPDPTGGWEDIPTGPFTFKYYNCDGLSFASSGWWNAVVIRAEGDDYNYDCRLYDHSTGAFDGFDLTSDISEWPAGQIDAVLVNRRKLGSALWDVGVAQSIGNAGTSAEDGYEAVHVTSQFLPMDTDTTVTLDPFETLALREFYVGSSDLGPYSVYLGRDTAAPKGWALLLDHDFERGSLNDWIANCTVIPPRTEARMDFEITEAGNYCLVIYRELDDLNVTAHYPLRIEPTKPDPGYSMISGWHSPMVPRPALDGTPSAVPLPTVLQGEVAQTYLNTCIRNGSPASLGVFTGGLYLDDSMLLFINWAAMDPYETRPQNHLTAWYVRGGRHALSLRLDESDLIAELDEDDNTYSEQYVWEPSTLSYAAPLVRSAPPLRTAGWWDIIYDLNGPLYYNCDGLRTPTTAVYWSAVAVMPGSDCDVDVRLHDQSTGAKDGFGESHALSDWSVGESDYSLVNFNLLPYVQHDVGILNFTGDEPYTVEAVAANLVGYEPNGTYGPYDITAGHILRLHEVYLTQGPIGIHLQNLSGEVDWGFTLHDKDALYAGKGDFLAEAISWMHGPGQNEGFYAEIPEGGYYCLAVWKRGADDLPLDGSYQLVFEPGATHAGEIPTLPLVTRLGGIHPNPFNPQTTIHYELALPTRVRLEVVDLRGRHVRHLLDQTVSAGRHGLVWNGRDDQGHFLASGVYVVHMATENPPTSTHRKVTLVK